MSVDRKVETAFLRANLRVFSNAKNHRQDPDVPLVVPTVNLKHLDVLRHQKKINNLDQGFLVCNSNCAVVALAVPLAALLEQFGPVECCSVVTMQAVRVVLEPFRGQLSATDTFFKISGAGYPGVSSKSSSHAIVIILFFPKERGLWFEISNKSFSLFLGVCFGCLRKKS